MLIDVFEAIASPTRRALLLRLSGGEQSVSALAKALRLTLPAVSQQLRLLRHVGLVRQQRFGRQRICRLNARPLSSVIAWIEVCVSAQADAQSRRRRAGSVSDSLVRKRRTR